MPTVLRDFTLLCLVSFCGTSLCYAQAEDSRTTKVDEIFAQFNKPGIPGCAVGVYRDGGVLYAQGYGEADVEHGVKITPHTIFYIASTAKQFTAMSIWLLAKQRRLSVDDDIRKYIPEIPDYGPPISIRHLLYHTSGLRDYTDLIEMAGHRPQVSTNADILSLTIRQKRLNFPTGTRHQYTNSNYILLAEIVKRVSGRTLRDFAKTNIFDPLGMNNTQYVDDHRLIIRDRAVGYAAIGEGKYGLAITNAIRVGPAGLYTSVEDLLRWDRNFYDPTVGSKELLRDLLTPGRLADGTTLDYASGLTLGTYRGIATVRHSGHSIGFRSELLRFPTLKFSVATLCNDQTGSRPERLAEQVADVYLVGQLADSVNAPDASADQRAVAKEQFGAVLGDYWNPQTGEVRQLVLRNERPVYIIDSWSRIRLTAVSATKFVFGRNPNEINVTMTAKGKHLTLRWFDGRVENYEELRRVKLDAAQLEKYAGEYYSHELDTTYVLEPNKTGLTIKRKNQEDRQLLPTAVDRFSEGSVRIRFLRDRRNRLSMLLFSDGDVSDIEFIADCR